MTHTDKLRTALRDAGVPLSRAQLVDATGVESEAVSKLLYAAKQRGEFAVSMLDGKPAYALNPDYVAPGRGHRPKRAATPEAVAPTGAAPTATPAPAKPPVAPTTAPAASATAPEPSPADKLAGFARSTSALADETLEQAVRMPAPPELVLVLTQASRLLHAAALRLAGGAA